MGLLPEAAHGLLPGDRARSPAGAVAHAGWLITAYALGVVAGAPATALTNGIGAMLGGLAIGHGLGYLSPAWVGAGLGSAGLVVAAVSFRLDRPPAVGCRPRARAAPMTRA
jgi:predicted MFS family arabinose efflux permease